MERTEENLMNAINHIGGVYATRDMYGVEIYPSYSAYEANPAGNFFMLVSDEDTSFADVDDYGYNHDLSWAIDHDTKTKVYDEVINFIYGGGHYAIKQPITA